MNCMGNNIIVAREQVRRHNSQTHDFTIPVTLIMTYSHVLFIQVKKENFHNFTPSPTPSHTVHEGKHSHKKYEENLPLARRHIWIHRDTHRALQLLTTRVNAQMTHIQVQNWKISWIHNSHTKPTALDLLNVCSSHAHFKLQQIRIKKAICSLGFWHTCDLKIRSRSSTLIWIARPQARL